MLYKHDGHWEAVNGEIFHSIPGDESGPNEDSITFVLSKLESIDHCFDRCSSELLSIAQEWDSIDKSLSARELFKISAISVETTDNSEWEICFETKPDFKWIYIGLQFQREDIVSNDIST